jgi:hypothetical protein
MIKIHAVNIIRNLMRNFLGVLVFAKVVTLEINAVAGNKECGSEQIRYLVARFYSDERVITVQRHSSTPQVDSNNIGGPAMDDGFETFGIHLKPNETYLGHFVEDNQIIVTVEIREASFVSQRVFVYDAYGNFRQETKAIDFFYLRLPKVESNVRVESLYIQNGRIYRQISILEDSVRSFRTQVFNRQGELLEVLTPGSTHVRRSQEQ